jgi:hypothetical protein
MEPKALQAMMVKQELKVLQVPPALREIQVNLEHKVQLVRVEKTVRLAQLDLEVLQEIKVRQVILVLKAQMEQAGLQVRRVIWEPLAQLVLRA